MDDESEIIGIVNRDVRRWMQSQPPTPAHPHSKPVGTAAVNWAQLHNVDPTVVVMLDFRRDQGIGWHGADVYSHVGADALGRCAQHATDAYFHATKHRLEDESGESDELCEEFLKLLGRLVRMLSAQDHQLAEGIVDDPTEDFVPSPEVLMKAEPPAEEQRVILGGGPVRRPKG